MINDGFYEYLHFSNVYTELREGLQIVRLLHCCPCRHLPRTLSKRAETFRFFRVLKYDYMRIVSVSSKKNHQTIRLSLGRKSRNQIDQAVIFTDHHYLAQVSLKILQPTQIFLCY